MVASKTALVFWTLLVAVCQAAADIRLVVVIKDMPAPLNGHCSRKLVPLFCRFNTTGAAICPNTPAAGNTFPPASKNEAVL